MVSLYCLGEIVCYIGMIGYGYGYALRFDDLQLHEIPRMEYNRVLLYKRTHTSIAEHELDMCLKS